MPEEIVFIGGQSDGKKLAVDTRHAAIEIPTPDQPHCGPVRTEVYRRAVYSFHGGKRIHVMVIAGMEDWQATERLVEFYASGRPKG